MRKLDEPVKTGRTQNHDLKLGNSYVIDEQIILNLSNIENGINNMVFNMNLPFDPINNSRDMSKLPFKLSSDFYDSPPATSLYRWTGKIDFHADDFIEDLIKSNEIWASREDNMERVKKYVIMILFSFG